MSGSFVTLWAITRQALSIHGILQERISFSRCSSQLKDWTHGLLLASSLPNDSPRPRNATLLKRTVSYIGQYTRLGSSRGRSCPFFLPPVATAPSKPCRRPGSQAPSHPRSRWNRRQHRKSRARGRSCPVPGCPALGPPESGGSGGRQTPLRRAGTCGGQEGSEHGARPTGTGQGAVGKRLLTYAWTAPWLPPPPAARRANRMSAFSSPANRRLAWQPLREAELECRRGPVSASPELRLSLRCAGVLLSSELMELAQLLGARLRDWFLFCACDGWLCPLINFVGCTRGIWSLHDVYFLLPCNTVVRAFIFSPHAGRSWGQDLALTSQGFTEGK